MLHSNTELKDLLMKFMRDNDIDVASYAEVANLSEILEEISKDDPNGNICWLDSGK